MASIEDDDGFSHEVRARDDGVDIVLAGELDLNGAPRLSDVLLRELSAKPAKVTVDLSDFDVVDSAGIAVLVSGLKQARIQETAMVLTGVHGRVLHALEVTGLTRVFDIQ